MRGPSITPRPPQGQPGVTALAHATIPYRLAARGPMRCSSRPTTGDAQRIVAEIRSEEVAVGRQLDRLRIFADLVVFLDDEPGAAAARKDHLDQLDGDSYRSDAFIFAGTRACSPNVSSPGRSRGSPGSGSDRYPATRPGSDHPQAGAAVAAAGRIPAPLRGGHAARPARVRPTGQPVRGGLTDEVGEARTEQGGL